MASPTAGELATQLQEACELINDTLTHLEGAALTNYDNYIAALESDFVAAQTAGADSWRSLAAGSVSRQAIQFILNPWILAYTHHLVGTPERDAARGLSRIYDYWIANSITIQSRGIAHGSVSAGGSNVGNGVLHRLVVDAQGLELEAVHLETKTADCIADQDGGANRFEELFLFRGSNAGRDALQLSGSGLRKRINARSGRQSRSYGSLLQNPSFSQYTAGTAPSTGSPQTPTAVTGWTIGTIASTQLDVDTVYRSGMVGDTTPTSLRMTAATTLSQKLSVAGIRWNRARPAFLEVPVYRESSADGTLTIRLGATSQAFTVSSALTNAQWNLVRLDFDADLWYENWAEDEADVSIEWTSRTTGSLVFDDVLLCEWTFFGGTWVCMVSGSTPNQYDDTYSYADALDSSDSVIQKVLFRGYGVSLPHSGTPSISDA